MRLEIICQDRLGITQDVLDILVEHNIDLRGIEIDPVGKMFLNFPTIEFDDFQHLMPKIRRIDGIDDVKTTAFMPIEREKHQLRAVLQTLPDPVFSIDRRGVITQINDAIEVGLGLPATEIVGKEITDFVKGFNFQRWLDSKQVHVQALKLKFTEQDYLADILPIYIQDSDDSPILAGAVVMLKSELRLGQQLTAFNQPQSQQFDSIVSYSAAMKKVIKQARVTAATELSMLICGEAGVGKKTLARACHASSHRASEEYLCFDPAGLSEAQIEMALFGCTAQHNNAPEGKTGLIELASNGSLYIQQVDELPLSVQARLKRCIEEKQFSRIGDDRLTPTSVRIIAGTSLDLNQLRSADRFRQDLLNVLQSGVIYLPPLRERKADIPPLAEFFIKQFCLKSGRGLVRLQKAAVEYIQTYPWPNNVQQLQDCIERALNQTEGNEITREDLQLPTNATMVTFIDENFEGSLDEEVKKFEKDLLQRLYPFYPSTRQLAKKLGLSHTAIANKLRDYGINRSSVKS